MGVAKKNGYQLSINLENGQKYSMMFVEGTLGDMKKHHHIFEKLSSATNSKNILSKKRTGMMNQTITMHQSQHKQLLFSSSQQLNKSSHRPFKSKRSSSSSLTGSGLVQAFSVYFWFSDLKQQPHNFSHKLICLSSTMLGLLPKPPFFTTLFLGTT